MNSRRRLQVGAILAAVGVAAGAFGAHALEGVLSTKDAATFEVAVRYHLLHAIALCALAALPTNSRALDRGAALITWGTLIFAGTLYALVLSGQRWLGAVTPIGGSMLIVGWLFVAASGANRPRDGA
jgi:uncharacterized membrane protein YgdD (TMEM256/DUF423 family)